MWPFGTQTKEQVNTQEAYNIWDMLQIRYSIVELIQIMQNFIHDKDFKALDAITLNTVFEDQINELEGVMNNCGLGLPRRPPVTVRTPANTEAIEDRFVAGLFLTMLQENLSMHLRTIRISLTDDNLRKLPNKFLRSEIGVYDEKCVQGGCLNACSAAFF